MGWIIVVLLDVSGSMDQEDIPPSRLQAARKVIADFVETLETDRVALVTFVDIPLTRCPLTFDYSIVNYYIDMLVGDQVYWFSSGTGTAIGDAIILATEKFDENLERTKIVLLLTDGESNQGIAPKKAATYAETKGVHIYPIYVNTHGGALPFLQDVAQITGGKAYSATSPESLKSIFEEIEALERSDLENQGSITYVDTPNIFFILFLLALNSYFLIKMFSFKKS